MRPLSPVATLSDVTFSFAELLASLRRRSRLQPQSEAEQLAEQVRHSVRTASRQREVADMGKSYAEILEDRAALKAKQDMLLRQLRKRFRKLPPAIEAQIQATQDVTRLDTWIEEFATAKKLSDISFDPAP